MTTLYFLFSDNKLVVPKAHCLSLGITGLASIPADSYAEYHEQSVSISKQGGFQHLLIDMQKQCLEHEELALYSLRELLTQMPAADFQHVAQAWQYALFLRTHRFCGQCGSRMDKVQWEMAMHCHTCQHRSYPRVSPCIIVAIRHGNKILLAQGERQKQSGYYSTLAGFVESGESLEQAVHREVKEEVGVQVKNLEYYGSQPWPFPHSLMMGYLAEYDSGDIKVDGHEIIDAKWFDFDELPNVPPKFSIAGHLIEETQKRIRRATQK